MARPLRADQQRLAVVRKLELRPAAEEVRPIDAPALLNDVEDGEGRAVKVFAVVQEDSAAGGGGNGEDVARGVIGGEVGRVEEELAHPLLGRRVPEAHRVVLAAGDEVIVPRVRGQAGDAALVALEVADKGVVVGREVSYGVCAGLAGQSMTARRRRGEGLRTVLFGAGVYYA